MALLTRNIDARMVVLLSSFGVDSGISDICLYTASNASSLYDQVLLYAFETYMETRTVY